MSNAFVVPAKNEKWRFSGLKEVDLRQYAPHEGGITVGAPEGCHTEDPKKLAGELEVLFEKRFTDFGSGSLEALTDTPTGQGFYLSAQPFSLAQANSMCEMDTERSLFTLRSLIDVQPMGNLTFVEMLGGAAKESLALTATRLRVGKRGTLHYVLLQNAPLDAKVFNFLEIDAQEGAQVTVTLLNFGGSYVRQELTALVKGSGANVELRSLSLGGDTQEIDQRTLQLHEEPGAKSDLLFKNVLADKSHGIFSGLIRVAPAAQQTDAYQKNRNLLMGAEAEANTLPGLEIEANDVKCSHGATVGRLDPQELFYMQSRGIPQQEAKALLVGGFCEEIIAQLPEELQEWARTRVAERLG